MMTHTDLAAEMSDLSPVHQFEYSTQSVYSRLREALLNGEIPPGQKLVTEALVAKFGLSRTPIRSALAVLASQGLVRYISNRGYFSIKFGLDEIISGVEMRARLLGYAAYKCALQPERGRLVNTLTPMCDDMAAIVAGGSWGQAGERSWHMNYYEFHRAVRYAVNLDTLGIAIRSTMMLPYSGDPVRLSPSLAGLVDPKFCELDETVPDYAVLLTALLGKVTAHIANGEAERADALMQENALAWKDRINAALVRS